MATTLKLVGSQLMIRFASGFATIVLVLYNESSKPCDGANREPPYYHEFNPSIRGNTSPCLRRLILLRKMNREEAFQCTQLLSTKNASLDLEGAREIRNGWYFPWRVDDEMIRSHGPVLSALYGSSGVIVDKQTHKVLQLSSGYPVERDLRAFESGYPLNGASLIVTSVTDEGRALEILEKLRISTVEPEFAHGVTWQIAKPLSTLELQTKLQLLPADFGAIEVYSGVEHLEIAKQESCFSFELKEGDA